MEGKRPVIFFLLLVTASSVMGLDFAFSKKAYVALLDALFPAESNSGSAFTDAEPIQFLNIHHDEELIVGPDAQVEEGNPRGIHMVPKDIKTVTAGIAGVQYQGPDPEVLAYVSIFFTQIKHQTSEISSGNLLICFDDIKQHPHDTCMIAMMFSPPQASEDKIYAKQIAEELNPLSTVQLKSIKERKPFKWALSSLKKVSSSGIKKIVISSDEEHSAFLLKPIIVDEKLLKQYFELANPNGSIEELDKPSF